MTTRFLNGDTLYKPASVYLERFNKIRCITPSHFIRQTTWKQSEKGKKVGKIVSYFPAQIRPSVHTSLDFSLRWSGGECLGTRRSSLFKLCTPSELESATITKTRQEKQDTVGQKERENNA